MLIRDVSFRSACFSAAALKKTGRARDHLVRSFVVSINVALQELNLINRGEFATNNPAAVEALWGRELKIGGVCQLRSQMSTVKMQPRCGAAFVAQRPCWLSPKGLTRETSHYGYYKRGIALSRFE
jgi:hypothetical protein